MKTESIASPANYARLKLSNSCFSVSWSFNVKFTFSHNIYSRCGNTTLEYISYPISLNISNTVFLIQGDQEDGDTNAHNLDTCDDANPCLLLRAHGFWLNELRTPLYICNVFKINDMMLFDFEHFFDLFYQRLWPCSTVLEVPVDDDPFIIALW